MTEIPRTDSVDVAKVAVAWEITKMSVMGTDEYIAGKGPEKRTALVNAFGEIFNAVLDGSPLRLSEVAQAPPAEQAEPPQTGQAPQAGQPAQVGQAAQAGRAPQARRAAQAGKNDGGDPLDIRSSFSSK